MEIEGKLHVKFETQNVSEKFQKRDFVVEYSDNPSYPQFISFQLTQDRCGNLDQFNVGDKINVTFNLRGREWKSPQGEIKYFNTLEAWRINKVEMMHQVSVPNQIPSVMSSISSGDSADDMPF